MDNGREFRTVRGYQLLEHATRMLSPAMEDYLEMICRHSRDEGYVRVNNLAEMLHVKASSASKMVQKLGKLGMLKYERYGIVTMTDRGREVGEFLLARHGAIEDFLKFLSGGDDMLVQTELIEHSVDPATVDRMQKLCNFFSVNKKIADKFREYTQEQPNEQL